MRWRQVIGLWVVAVVLGGWYWGVELHRVEPVRSVDRPPFVAIDPAALREVRVRRQGLAMVSRWDGAAWVVVEPKGGIVPSDLIAAFANALASSQEIARIADRADDVGQ